MKQKLLMVALFVNIVLINQVVFVNASTDEIDYTKMQEYEFANGITQYGYIGENGVDGYGMVVSDEGNSYDGILSDGELSTWGVLTYNSGDMVIGEHVDSVKEGENVHIFDDSSTLVVNYVDGKMNGDGIFFSTQLGDLYLGKWEDDELLEIYDYDSWTNDDGLACIGTNVNGKLEGMGSCKNAEKGEIYLGEFENGNPHGIGVTGFEDGTLEVGMYLNGELNGYFTFFTEDNEKLMGFKFIGLYIGELAYYKNDGTMIISDKDANVLGTIKKN